MKISENEVTPHDIYNNRREFIKKMSIGAALSSIGSMPSAFAQTQGYNLGQVATLSSTKSTYSTTEKQTSYSDITSDNNYYEFGTGE